MSKSNTKSKDSASFRNPEDAGKFLSIFTIMPASELKLFVLFHFLQSSLPEELVRATWASIDWQNSVWVIDPSAKVQTNPYTGNQPIAKVVYLSGWAMQVLNELRGITGNQAQLFPMLHVLKKDQREQIIADFVRQTWMPYHVDVNSFREFFADVCTKHSGFKPAFVQEVTKNSVKSLTFSDVIQRRALTEYWSSEMSRHASAHRYNYSPNM